ncbi:MAG: hypothetical protein WD824_23865 [Cyclobacteriaceae bacterium]
MDKKIEEIKRLLEGCSVPQRKLIFMELRKEFSIHPIEEKLKTQAEIILSAINKDASGLTYRMLRGVIAEAAFEIEVISTLSEWRNVTPEGDFPFDYVLSNGIQGVSVQVKLQRSKNLNPMTANQASRKFSKELFVVETQKTRGGIDIATKEDTRPYRFNEFDILAVSMQPSTGKWMSFMYTVGNWLIPQEGHPKKMYKFQPVSPIPNNDWTDNFETCVKWLNQNLEKKIKF